MFEKTVINKTGYSAVTVSVAKGQIALITEHLNSLTGETVQQTLFFDMNSAIDLFAVLGEAILSIKSDKT